MTRQTVFLDFPQCAPKQMLGWSSPLHSLQTGRLPDIPPDTASTPARWGPGEGLGRTSGSSSRSNSPTAESISFPKLTIASISACSAGSAASWTAVEGWPARTRRTGGAQPRAGPPPGPPGEGSGASPEPHTRSRGPTAFRIMSWNVGSSAGAGGGSWVAAESRIRSARSSCRGNAHRAVPSEVEGGGARWWWGGWRPTRRHRKPAEAAAHLDPLLGQPLTLHQLQPQLLDGGHALPVPLLRHVDLCPGCLQSLGRTRNSGPRNPQSVHINLFRSSKKRNNP